MRVRVTRHSGNSAKEVFECWYGVYVSKVYAIDGDKFLVYDPGDYQSEEGFDWVSIYDTMHDPGGPMYDEDGHERIERCVTLVEDDDE